VWYLWAAPIGENIMSKQKHRGTADRVINIGHEDIYQDKNPDKTPVSGKLVLFRISLCLY